MKPSCERGNHRAVLFGEAQVTADTPCDGCGKTWGELGLPTECMHRYSERGRDGVIRCDFCGREVRSGVRVE